MDILWITLLYSYLYSAIVLWMAQNSFITVNTTYLLISMDKNNTKSCRLEPAAAGHRDIVTFTDVVDVNWNAGVGAYTVLLHQWNELRLRQVVRWACLLLQQLQLPINTHRWKQHGKLTANEIIKQLETWISLGQMVWIVSSLLLLLYYWFNSY